MTIKSPACYENVYHVYNLNIPKLSFVSRFSLKRLLYQFYTNHRIIKHVNSSLLKNFHEKEQKDERRVSRLII